MKKATITPMDYYYYQLHVHKISKKDLKEAGIIIDYTDDEPYKAAKKIQETKLKKKDDKINENYRWLFLAIITLYLSITIWVGWQCANPQATIEIETSQTYEQMENSLNEEFS